MKKLLLSILFLTSSMPLLSMANFGAKIGAVSIAMGTAGYATNKITNNCPIENKKAFLASTIATTGAVVTAIATKKPFLMRNFIIDFLPVYQTSGGRAKHLTRQTLSIATYNTHGLFSSFVGSALMAQAFFAKQQQEEISENSE